MLAAYALGALDSDEQRFVETHLDACPSCRAQYGAYLDTTTLLAKAVPQKASPSVIEQALLQQARADVARKGAAPSDVREQEEYAGVFERLMNGLRRIWHGAMKLAPLGLIAALIAICALAYQVLQLSNQLSTLQARFDQQAQVIQTFQRAYTAQTDLYGAMAATGASATLRYSPNIKFGLLKVNNLATLPDTQAYQLWLVDATGKRDSGAVFNVPARTGGEAIFVVQAPRTFDNYVRFGVSIEPASGSPGPTGPAALTMQKPAP
jgi:anti-sigma-K factor RskA